MHYNSKEPYIVDPHTAVGLTAATIVAPSKCVRPALSPNYNSQINLISTYSPPQTVQIILSTAHPAKFAEAVIQAIPLTTSFDFDRDVLPAEFRGLLRRKKSVINVDKPDIGLVRSVIENELLKAAVKQ